MYRMKSLLIRNAAKSARGGNPPSPIKACFAPLQVRPERKYGECKPAADPAAPITKALSRHHRSAVGLEERIMQKIPISGFNQENGQHDAVD
jgi:hypothetical protein